MKNESRKIIGAKSGYVGEMTEIFLAELINLKIVLFEQRCGDMHYAINTLLLSII